MSINKNDKKEAIFEATLQLIVERGFHGTPTSAIAKQAGIANGTLYLYFDSKEQLLNQLYIKLKKHLAEDLIQGLCTDATIQEELEIVWYNVLNHLLSYPIEFAFIEQFENSPLLDKATLELSSEIFQPAYALLTKARTRKVVKDISNELLIFLFFAPMSYCLKQYIRLKRKPVEEMISTLYQGCWDAIKR